MGLEALSRGASAAHFVELSDWVVSKVRPQAMAVSFVPDWLTATAPSSSL